MNSCQSSSCTSLKKELRKITNLPKTEAVRVLRGFKELLRRSLEVELCNVNTLKLESTVNSSVVQDEISTTEYMKNKCLMKVRKLEMDLIEVKRKHFALEEELEESVLDLEANIKFLEILNVQDETLGQDIKCLVKGIADQKFRELDLQEQCNLPKKQTKLNRLKKMFLIGK